MRNNSIKQFMVKNDYETEKTSLGKQWWYVKTLAKCESLAFGLDLLSIDLSVMPWELNSIETFISHYYDVNDCEDSFPIIVSPGGWIMNGWHRVCKAIIEGKTTITANRILILPDPDGENK